MQQWSEATEQNRKIGEGRRKISKDDVSFTLVYDNKPYKLGLVTGWGFSCFIETARGCILFDTGWNGNVLLHNLKKLNIAPGDIHKLVLSHNHWDHIGGTNHIITSNPNIELFIPTSFSKHLKEELSTSNTVNEVYEPQEILPGCWSTGEHGSKIIEQSLLVNTKNGFVLVTGCSHPGLDIILSDARNHGKVYGALGGFHGFKNFNALKGLGFVMPCHCTQHSDEIEVYYNHIYTAGGVGRRVTL